MLNAQMEINRILIEAENSASSLRSLYQLQKAHHHKISFSYLCRRAGIPSKGYLSFVMSGKRRLNAKYWDAVCEAFKLNEEQARVMRLLLALDSNPELCDVYVDRIKMLRTQLLSTMS